VRIQLPRAHPLAHGRIVVAVLLVPDRLADVRQRILRIVSGALLEGGQRLVRVQLELRPGQDPQRNQTGRHALQRARGQRGSVLETMLESRPASVGDQVEDVGHGLVVLQQELGRVSFDGGSQVFDGSSEHRRAVQAPGLDVLHGFDDAVDSAQVSI